MTAGQGRPEPAPSQAVSTGSCRARGVRHRTASDHDVLRASRVRVPAAADVIVPGHGPAFPADGSAPH